MANYVPEPTIRHPRRTMQSSMMIPASYKPKKRFMELAIAEAKRAGDRGDYPIGAVMLASRAGARSLSPALAIE